jgi:hypothetical protein
MQAYLQEAMPDRTHLFTVGIIAFFITLSMTIPFSSILIGAVLLRQSLSPFGGVRKKIARAGRNESIAKMP